MANDSCDTSTTPAESRYAAEWGLATLLLAGFLVIAAVLTIVLATVWIAFLIGGNARQAFLVPMAIVGLVTLVFWCTSVVAVLFGRHSVRAAWARGQAGGLPLAGALLAIVGCLLWSAIALGLGLTFFYVAMHS